ncbi:hypothetical protein STPH1_1652 [Streptomyces sp. OM5714]|nr:hypothetical protein STPH1_1652 [Streptomyces sp. OM5714]
MRVLASIVRNSSTAAWIVLCESGRVEAATAFVSRRSSRLTASCPQVSVSCATSSRSAATVSRTRGTVRATGSSLALLPTWPTRSQAVRTMSAVDGCLEYTSTPYGRFVPAVWQATPVGAATEAVGMSDPMTVREQGNPDGARVLAISVLQW